MKRCKPGCPLKDDDVPVYIFKPETNNVHEKCRYHNILSSQPSCPRRYMADIFISSGRKPDSYKIGTLDGKRVALGHVDAKPTTPATPSYDWGIGHHRISELKEIK